MSTVCRSVLRAANTFKLQPLYFQRRFDHIGATSSVSRTITAEDVKAFAEFSHDNNPLHLDEEFAKQTMFGRCVAHGLLTNGLVSGALARLPGAAGGIFVKQEIKFTAPVFVGETVEAKVAVTELQNRKAVCSITCTAGDKVVIEGTALVLLAKK